MIRLWLATCRRRFCLALFLFNAHVLVPPVIDFALPCPFWIAVPFLYIFEPPLDLRHCVVPVTWAVCDRVSSLWVGLWYSVRSAPLVFRMHIPPAFLSPHFIEVVPLRSPPPVFLLCQCFSVCLCLRGGHYCRSLYICLYL